jgi:antimicrobial peptide system SdpB family protein
MRRVLSRLADWTVRQASVCDPRSRPVAVARTILAAAQASVLLFSSDRILFSPRPELPDGIRCNSVRGLSVWCIAGPRPALMLAIRVAAITTLLLIASGYRPRWTCIPHWYIAFSFSASTTVPTGGDTVAQIVTMLLIPVCLGDRRTWQWSRSSAPLQPRWRGASYASLLALRAQISIVYVTAAVSKLAYPQWRDGTAMYNIAFDPSFGMPVTVRRAASVAVGPYPLIALLTWSVVAIELGVAVLALGNLRMRRFGLVLVVALHMGIVVVLGLFSFGLTMIAAVAAAYTGKPLRYGDEQAMATHQADSSPPVAGGMEPAVSLEEV